MQAAKAVKGEKAMATELAGKVAVVTHYLIAHNALIEWFKKVNSPTESSTYSLNW
jgi:hypothetical protein